MNLIMNLINCKTFVKVNVSYKKYERAALVLIIRVSIYGCKIFILHNLNHFNNRSNDNIGGRNRDIFCKNSVSIFVVKSIAHIRIGGSNNRRSVLCLVSL